MSIMPPGPDSNTSTLLSDAAHNAVAVAGLALQQEMAHFRYIATLAASKGLTEPEIVTASGLPAALVRELLAGDR